MTIIDFKPAVIILERETMVAREWYSTHDGSLDGPDVTSERLGVLAAVVRL